MTRLVQCRHFGQILKFLGNILLVYFIPRQNIKPTVANFVKSLEIFCWNPCLKILDMFWLVFLTLANVCDIGLIYLVTVIFAVFLIAQFEKLDEWNL